MPASPIYTQPPGREVLVTLAVLLRVLLAMVFGAGARPRRDHRALDGCIQMVPELPELPELEDDVEWVWVPVPWRAAFWWVKPRRGAFMAPCPVLPGPRAALVRAPPGRRVLFAA